MLPFEENETEFSSESDPTFSVSTHESEDPPSGVKDNKESNVKPRLILKIKKHVRRRVFTCDGCGKGFARKSYLDLHIKSHSGEEKPFTCEQCGRGFIRKGNLNIHLIIHAENKPFNCEQCGKGFSHRGIFNMHMRTHTGEKPFHCEQCGKNFSQKGELNKHMRTHTGEKPYRCKVCGKEFSQNGNLNMHLRIHTGERPFQCGVCRKGFTQKRDLDRHSRTHTGERPFVCLICGKGFSRKAILDVHLRLHANSKFIRSRLGEGFRQEDSPTQRRIIRSADEIYFVDNPVNPAAAEGSWRPPGKTPKEEKPDWTISDEYTSNAKTDPLSVDSEGCGSYLGGSKVKSERGESEEVDVKQEDD